MLQKLFRPLAKNRTSQIDVRALRVVALKQGELKPLSLFESAIGGHVAGEDLGRRSRKKPSLDDRVKAKPWRSGDDGVSKGGVHFGLRMCADPCA